MNYSSKYTEMRTIGKGSFGHAFLVKNNLTKKQYISKKIDITGMSPEDIKKVEQEVILMQRFSHPHIVKYIESFTTEADIIIIMEYCAGGDLAQLVSYHKSISTPFPEATLLEWLGQLSSALEHIHSLKIIHRDIKPSNVFMTSGGKLKLGDFGVSKILEHTNDVAVTQIGTPLYMSPEVCNSMPYTNKSDIWALGCVLYEMASFERAFTANSLVALAMQIIESEPIPIPKIYSAKLSKLIDKMLLKNPARRPTALELLGDTGFVPSYDSKNVSSFIDEFREEQEFSLISGLDYTLGFETSVSLKIGNASTSYANETYEDDFESVFNI
ncbi:hypothetical protein SteCoe_4509 [Stentor coeruleus]|uniref:non-specific serine/threonine protein kinase n=1 Tax=Stentor coeruleus TaxID=5963 RepID=A0A1R2CUF3_9CILI|nr:hypothetical protein SteCoe_4509 [Stentor coeruleus]